MMADKGDQKPIKLAAVAERIKAKHCRTAAADRLIEERKYDGNEEQFNKNARMDA